MKKTSERFVLATISYRKEEEFEIAQKITELNKNTSLSNNTDVLKFLIYCYEKDKELR